MTALIDSGFLGCRDVVESDDVVFSVWNPKPKIMGLCLLPWFTHPASPFLFLDTVKTEVKCLHQHDFFFDGNTSA
ncbi:hypothetical protein SORBI_3003G338250 [Sorghum bicolor]|jgi:hypothetical protein|uniref:Uncharacterized protein n=1 Tax=Sorghum bicolor TaxID=4558 RepID=A0A1W0W060_SORBI|nr:hypothetical protein SORBI_3003G338250 [Sorghum bicolor]